MLSKIIKRSLMRRLLLLSLEQMRTVNLRPRKSIGTKFRKTILVILERATATVAIRNHLRMIRKKPTKALSSRLKIRAWVAEANRAIKLRRNRTTPQGIAMANSNPVEEAIRQRIRNLRAPVQEVNPVLRRTPEVNPRHPVRTIPRMEAKSDLQKIRVRQQRTRTRMLSSAFKNS